MHCCPSIKNVLAKDVRVDRYVKALIINWMTVSQSPYFQLTIQPHNLSSVQRRAEPREHHVIIEPSLVAYPHYLPLS